MTQTVIRVLGVGARGPRGTPSDATPALVAIRDAAIAAKEDAEDAAATSTAQAVIATAQAVIATAQATLATAKATVATDQATLAAGYAGDAEDFADASFGYMSDTITLKGQVDAAVTALGVLAGNTFYADEATGRAAVSNGVAYLVKGGVSDEFFVKMFTRVDGSTSTENASSPSLAYLQGFEADIEQIDPTVAKTAMFVTQFAEAQIIGKTADPSSQSNAAAGSWVLGTPVSANGAFTTVDIYSGASATVTVYKFSRNSAGLLTRGTLLATLSVTSGLHSYNINTEVDEGDYIGFQSATIGWAHIQAGAAATTGFYFSSDATATSFTDLTNDTSATLQVRCNLTVLTVAARTEATEAEVDTTTNRVDVLNGYFPITEYLGCYNTPITGDSVSGGVYIFGDVIGEDTRVDTLDLFGLAGATTVVSEWTRSGDTWTKVKTLASLTTTAGLATYTVNRTVPAGHYVGISSATAGFVSSVTTTADTGYFSNATHGSSSFDDASETTSVQIQARFNLAVNARADYPVVIGKTDTPTTGVATVTGTIIYGARVVADGVCTTIDWWALAEATVTVSAWTLSGSTFTRGRILGTFDTTVGLNEFVVRKRVYKNEYIGFQSEDASWLARVTETAETGFYYSADGDAATVDEIDDAAIDTASQLQIRCHLYVLQESVAGEHVLNLRTAQRIVIEGPSYIAGIYQHKDKAPVSKVSLWSDYNFESAGFSGETVGSILASHVRFEQMGLYAQVSFKDMYAWGAMFLEGYNSANSSTLGVSRAVYVRHQKQGIETIRGTGVQPFGATEWHPVWNTTDQILLKHVSQEMDVPFCDFIPHARKMRGDARITASISGTTLTVTTAHDGPVTIGAVLTGLGVTTTTISAQTSGTTGGAGTYTVGTSQTVASRTMFAIPKYSGFWADSPTGVMHTGARTNHLIADRLGRFFDETLPRPLMSMKIFRPRSGVTVTSVQDLMFRDTYERNEVWKELSLNHGHLPTADARKFDLLSSGGYSTEYTQSEYMNMILGTAAEFDDYALLDCIIDTTLNGMEGLTIRIPTDATDMQVFIRDAYYATDIAVTCATTANITLSDQPTIDGVATSTNMLVLVKNQSTSSQNGVYIVPASGAWSRYSGMASWALATDARVTVLQGTTNEGTTWVSEASGSGTIGSTALTFRSADDETVSYWRELTGFDGVYELDHDDLIGCVHYDRVSILVYADGGFSLSEPSLTWTGTKGKPDYIGAPKATGKATGANLIEENAFTSDTLDDFFLDQDGAAASTTFELETDSTLGFPRVAAVVTVNTTDKLRIPIALDGINDDDDIEVELIVPARRKPIPFLNQDARLKTTANHGLSGLTAIDGVTPDAGDAIFVNSQTNSSENGLYTAASGAWARRSGMDSWSEVVGAFVTVTAGSTGANTCWKSTAVAGGTIGSTAITFTASAPQITEDNFDWTRVYAELIVSGETLFPQPKRVGWWWDQVPFRLVLPMGVSELWLQISAAEDVQIAVPTLKAVNG